MTGGEQSGNGVPRSSRKPHNHLAGYRAELRSKHPGLPGHIVIFDRANGGEWIAADGRWIVMHIDGDALGCMVEVGSMQSARELMKHVANGGDEVDLGQN